MFNISSHSKNSSPFVFFTSGFLFFYKINKNWNLHIYVDKLKKRSKTLLIPYIFWNALVLLLYFIAQNTPQLSSFFSGNNLLIKDYTIIDFFKAFWSMDNSPTKAPFLFTFWFIRDLIVIVILSPLVYLLVKYLKIYGILLLCIIWFFKFYSIVGLNSACLFFFSFGAYFSINNLNFLKVFNRFYYPTAILYSILAMLDLITKNTLIHNAGILVGLILLFNIVAFGIKNNKLHISVFLSSASFFLFAFHEPWLDFLRRFLFVYIKPASELEFLFIYFIPTLFIIALSLLVYFLLKKIIPRFTNIITGGR
ncbi:MULTISPECIES: acyltransferase family protein [Dysgonomonas]|nr:MULTISPECIES: acyltransferase family protein [Dysgonomonas]MBF0648771.1 acyltransferase family protein [Dysgonomonas sp. GY75]